MDFSIEFGYDRTNPKSIEAYAQKLIGKTFRQIKDADEKAIREEGTIDWEADSSEIKHKKGSLGQLIEECFFHYSCNSDARADFPEAGVELKVTPYKINKNGTL